MMFLVIAIANTAIGTVQEIRSKRAVDKLTLVAEHPAKAIREGRRVEVRPSLLVGTTSWNWPPGIKSAPTPWCAPGNPGQRVPHHR